MGGINKYELEDSALVIFSAHNSDEVQNTNLLYGILDKFNIDEEILFCKTHWSLNLVYSREMASSACQQSRIYNNCSEKHISMILMCKFFSFSTDMYFDSNHELQKLIFKYLSNIYNTKIESIAIDICSSPVPYLKSKTLVDFSIELTKGNWDESHAWNKIIYAMKMNPYLVGGTGRFDSSIMDKSDVHLQVKCGAEGVIILQSGKQTIIMKPIVGGREKKKGRGRDYLQLILLEKISL